MRNLLFLLFVITPLYAGVGQDLLVRLAATPLDAAECYRIREVDLVRDEAQMFFTDGYMIFTKPVNGAPAGAYFTTDVDGGDAELLLLPPLRNERRMMSAHTGSPNLEEHFKQAALVFSPDTYRDLIAEISRNPFNKKSPEMGALLAGRWTPLINTLGGNFGLRLAMDILSPTPDRKGFLAATFAGAKLGTFNLVFDSRVQEQLLIGAPADSGFDVWSSFTSRSFRARPFAPEFTIRDYRIDTRMDADLTMHCTTRITVTPARTEPALPFEISDKMHVLGATVNGVPVEVLMNRQASSTAYEVFVLVPAKPLPANEPVEVTIRHEGKVIEDAGNQVFAVGSRGTWYPNRGRQFARFDMTFKLPKDLDLVAGGDLIEDRVEGLNRISHWKTAVPICLAGFNVGVYDRARITQGGLTIEVCANRSVEAGLARRSPETLSSPQSLPRIGRRSGGESLGPVSAPPSLPPSPKVRLQALAKEVGDAMDFFTARFGPLELTRLEVTPVPGRFGQGFPGIIYLSTLSYLEPAEGPVSALADQQRLFFTDLLHAHESAHQWWGNIVTAAAYHDDWLMEALANYSALLYLEKRKGPRAVEAILEDYRQKLLAKGQDGEIVDSAGPVVQGRRLEQAWIPIVYGKGSWILHMLRRRMGDESFGRMLGALRKEYEGKTLGTEDFRTFCARYLPQKSSDPKLESFFDQWVYGTGIPTLKLTSAVKGRPGQWRVVGSVAQSGAGEEFAADVPVEIQLGKGRPVIRTVIAGAEPEAFEFSFPTQPTKVAIDYRSILHR